MTRPSFRLTHIGLISFLLLVLPVFSADKADLPAPQQLLDTATKLSDLSGLYPYQFNAHIVINRGTSSEKSGEVTIYRDRRDYSYDLRVGDYREVVSRAGNKVYTYYSAFPAPGLGVLRSIDKWPDELTSKNISGGTAKKKVGKLETYCINFKTATGWRLRGCFDPVQTLLLEISTEDNTKSFLNYQQVGEQLFPGTIRMARPELGQTVELEEIHIQKLPQGPITFEIPKGSHEFETCDDEQHAKRIDPVFSNPSFVPIYRGTPIVAYFYAIIDTEGKMHDLAVYSPNHHEDEWKKLAEAWRFKPALCGGKAITTVWLNSVVMKAP